MRHHKHNGYAGRLNHTGTTLTPCAGALDAQAVTVWFPVASVDGRGVDGLEALQCTPTREGAARIAAVPHVVDGLAFGDEVAVARWQDMLIARGELASALGVTIRIVAAQHQCWQDLAQLVDAAAGTPCVHDVMNEHALSSHVRRDHANACLLALTDAAAAGAVVVSCATPQRIAG